ncbi:MAG: caspase family protein, partial [Bacteroidales bacterium]|nr:caspase family protein [Bacteroidales bacterium]
MKNLVFLFLLTFISPGFNFSQTLPKIIVIPESTSNLCYIFQKDQTLKESIDEISEGFKRHGFRVVNFNSVLNQVKNNELCKNSQKLFETIIKKSNTTFYVKAEVKPVKTSTGNYVAVTLNVLDSQTNDFIAYGSAKSNKFNTTNFAMLTKRAFEKIIPDLKNEILASATAEEIVRVETPKVEQTSDVDINIPVNPKKNNSRYALIIGNEDYKSYQMGLESEINVDFAESDARSFKKYTEKTLGVPEENIILLINSRAVEMHQALDKMKIIAKSLNGNAELIFFYAGHGLPDEKTKEPYLIPVDVSGTNLQFAVKLKDVYDKLTEFPSKRVTVFLDACFSGGARNQGLVAARGVKVKPKQQMLKGNVIVFSASSGDQSSLPYKEKQHGMFTYFLLKKLQST